MIDRALVIITGSTMIDPKAAGAGTCRI